MLELTACCRCPGITYTAMLLSAPLLLFPHHAPAAYSSVAALHVHMKASPPPPPPLPPPLPATQLLKRDGSIYLSLAAIGVIPAVEWDQPASKAVGLVYFFSLATLSLYAGVLRQDLGEQAPITSNNAAAAPFVAGASLFGLYCLIKFADINPSTVYQFAACTFALVSSSELFAPLLGLLLVGGQLTADGSDATAVGRDAALSDEDEERVLKAGSIPSVLPPLLLLGAYSLGEYSRIRAAARPNLLAQGPLSLLEQGPLPCLRAYVALAVRCPC